MSVTVSNEPFLQWLDEELGIFSSGVKSYHTAEEQKARVLRSQSLPIKDDHEFDTPYQLKTRSHPYFKQLYSWYGPDGKQFPADLTLTPIKAKMWYCCDGSLIRSERQRPHARFYTSNESERLDVLVDYFKEQGIMARAYEGAVGFTADETEDLLEWMGPPPMGMEYKWI